MPPDAHQISYNYDWSYGNADNNKPVAAPVTESTPTTSAAPAPAVKQTKVKKVSYHHQIPPSGSGQFHKQIGNVKIDAQWSYDHKPAADGSSSSSSTAATPDDTTTIATTTTTDRDLDENEDESEEWRRQESEREKNEEKKKVKLNIWFFVFACSSQWSWKFTLIDLQESCLSSLSSHTRIKQTPIISHL